MRRFRTDPVDPDLVEALIARAAAAPSVGLSEPWRFVRVESIAARAAARANFNAANARALAGLSGARAALYAGLKLAGMDAAPVQIAVYCASDDAKGQGLGAATMPQMRAYSVVCAVMQMWLAARARGLGLGWVSILDPAALSHSLGVPQAWELIAYLCLGWPEEAHEDAELVRAGWEPRLGAEGRVLVR